MIAELEEEKTKRKEETELLARKLAEKVKALERQNALLKTAKTGDNLDGAAARSSIISTGDEDDIKLLEIEDFDGSEDNWLFDLGNGDQAVEDESDWLRGDVTSPTSGVALKKKSLVNKLDDIAKSKYQSVSQSYRSEILLISYNLYYVTV